MLVRSLCILLGVGALVAFVAGVFSGFSLSSLVLLPGSLVFLGYGLLGPKIDPRFDEKVTIKDLAKGAVEDATDSVAGTVVVAAAKVAKQKLDARRDPKIASSEAVSPSKDDFARAREAKHT